MAITRPYAMTVLLVGLWMAAAGGCGPKGPSPGGPADSATTSPAAPAASQGDKLLVLCGSSFRDPMEKLLADCEQATGIQTEISFEGSENFLPQVKLKAVGDVFVTHDPYMQYTEDAGAMLRWVHVGYVAPVLVVQKGNPKKVERIEDLAKPGLRVILPNPDFSTCGEMVMALLEKKKIKEAVLKNVGNRMFKSHSEVGNQMKLGYGDAAIMWNGAAHQFQDAVEIVPCPYEYDTETRVGVIGLSYSTKKDQLEKLLEYMDSHGPAIFEEFGYVK